MFFDEIKLGITTTEIRKIFPTVYPVTNGSSVSDLEMFGLNGKIYAEFKFNSLKCYKFEWVEFQINEENFDQCLSIINKICNNYSKKYGKPYSLEEGTMQFVDPKKTNHSGYIVIDSRWKTREKKFRAYFDFISDQGKYKFVFLMEFQGPDYAGF